MRKFVWVGVLAALCACAKEREQPAAETKDAPAAVAVKAPTMAEVAGTYEYTLEDGSSGTTDMEPDGTFSDTLAGEVVTGTWTVEGGMTCVDPEGERPEQQPRCYSFGQPDSEGVRTATADDGSVVKIRKLSA